MYTWEIGKLTNMEKMRADRAQLFLYLSLKMVQRFIFEKV